METTDVTKSFGWDSSEGTNSFDFLVLMHLLTELQTFEQVLEWGVNLLQISLDIVPGNRVS